MSARKPDAAAIRPCRISRFAQGCACLRCTLYARWLDAQEREQRIKEGLAYGQ